MDCPSWRLGLGLFLGCYRQGCFTTPKSLKEILDGGAVVSGQTRLPEDITSSRLYAGTGIVDPFANHGDAVPTRSLPPIHGLDRLC